MVDGDFEVVEVGGEAVGFVDAEDEGKGVTGGAEAQGRVGGLHGVGEYGGAQGHESLEFLVGNVEGLLAHAVDVLAEVGVGKPATQG